MNIVCDIVFAIAYAAVASAWFAVRQSPIWLIAVIPAFLIVNIFAGRPFGRIPRGCLRAEHHGVSALCVFFAAAVLDAALHVCLFFTVTDRRAFWFSVIWAFVTLAVLFWNGIIFVYFTSVQLGIRLRVIGVLCGLVPVANMIVLVKMIAVCRREVSFETDKRILDESRAADEVCKTKYPLLLVHGVFFRDYPLINYWGRIPAELKKNGATVYYGEHQSALCVADSAEELTRRIDAVLAKTGAQKVNIIAHSKGGLDCRWALAHGCADRVASLTTVNTPHRGCGFADYLLEKIPAPAQKKIEDAYNAAALKLGDSDPDFMAAVRDLTASGCEKFAALPMPDGVYCRSIGSCLKKASGGRFPMNFTHRLVKYFDGENDGLVAEDSFRWGDDYTYLVPPTKRGISHADMVDMNRENIPGFDVREFYVGLVAELKERGL